MTYEPLGVTADALAYQREWVGRLRAELAGGATYAFVNADTPLEIFHSFEMPVVVNQWWSSIIATKQLSTPILDRANEAGFHDRLAKYSALPMLSQLEADAELKPWGGLPTPSILCARQSADDHQRIFQRWARRAGVPLKLLHAPAPARNQSGWWLRVRDDWETFHGAARLDLMQAQLEELVCELGQITGRPFDRELFAERMERIEAQETVLEEVSRMIASAERTPIRIAEQIPNVMLPQWHRGSGWSLAHVRRFRDAVAARIAAGDAVCNNERVRMMWIGAGLWFDTGFYKAFEEEFGAVFAWSMYLPFASDGYIRRARGDHMRALAARIVSMNEQLHQPPWANEWLVSQARDYRIDLAVVLVPENDRPSGHGARFIAHDLHAAGVEVVEIVADMVDARKWNGEAATTAVAAGIRRVLNGNTAGIDRLVN